MFSESSPRSKGNQSKTESKISAIEQYMSMHVKDIRQLEDNLSKLTAEVDNLKHKWAIKQDVLRIQHRAQSPFWADSKEKMNKLLEAQARLALEIDKKKLTISSVTNSVNIGLSLFMETSMMQQLALAGSFKVVMNKQNLSENDEDQSDMSSLSDEDMCFPMDPV